MTSIFFMGIDTTNRLDDEEVIFSIYTYINHENMGPSILEGWGLKWLATFGERDSKYRNFRLSALNTTTTT